MSVVDSNCADLRLIVVTIGSVLLCQGYLRWGASGWLRVCVCAVLSLITTA